MFQHFHEVLQKLDENYPFVISNWLIIIITVFGTLFEIIICGTIHYIKYRAATGKVRHFLTLCNKKDEYPASPVSKLALVDKGNIEISAPKLMATSTPLKIDQHPRQGTHNPMKKNAIVAYNANVNQARIRSVSTENVQQCLQSMGLNVSMYNQF